MQVTLDYLGHAASVTSTITVLAPLQVTQSSPEITQDDNGRPIQVDQPFTACLARFTPVHPEDRPEDYQATIRWNSLATTSDGLSIRKADDGQMEVYAGTTMISGRYTYRLVIRGQDHMASVEGTVIGDDHLAINVTPRPFTAHRYQEFSGVIASFTTSVPDFDPAAAGITAMGATPTATPCTIVANADGGYDILATDTFTFTGTKSLDVTVSFGNRETRFQVTFEVID